jgi:metal-responsive CopG/Arc/MetJ family transcriptional regulator
MKELNQPTTFSLPESLVKLLEHVQRKRRDPTRSDTARILLLQALGSMSYLSASEKKALGITENGTRERGPIRPLVNPVDENPRRTRK